MMRVRARLPSVPVLAAQSAFAANRQANVASSFRFRPILLNNSVRFDHYPPVAHDG